MLIVVRVTWCEETQFKNSTFGYYGLVLRERFTREDGIRASGKIATSD